MAYTCAFKSTSTGMNAREGVTEGGADVAEGAGRGTQAPTAEHDGAMRLVEHFGAELERLQSQVSRSDVQIEAIQASVRKQRPWYLDIGPLISTVALLLSFSTTYYSCRQAESQQIHEARVELRGLLQRLSELPKENAGLVEQYRDPMVIGQISSFIQQENKLLALHAAELMAQLGTEDPGHVSTSDHILVSAAMFNSGLISEGLAILDQAEQEIRDGQDGATIYRQKGLVRFQMGDLTNGRAEFGRALAVFERFPTSSPFVEASTHTFTEASWAGAELGVRECEQAEVHLRRAFAHLAPYVSPGVANPLLSQLQAIETQLASCGTSEEASNRMGMQLSPLIAPLMDPDLERPPSGLVNPGWPDSLRARRTK